MANYSIKADLLKVKGAAIINLKGKTATKQCLVIPVDGSGLFVGEKGVYLNMTAVEMREPRYGDTHCVKINLDKDAYSALTEEERKAIPILGGLHEIERQSQTMAAAQTIDMTAGSDDEHDDLPF